MVDHKEIFTMRKNGKTLREIARHIGLSHQRVSQILGKTGRLTEAPRGKKRCYRCKINKLEEDFYSKSHVCKACTIKRIGKFSQKYRKEYLRGGRYYERVLARARLSYAIKTKKIKKGRCHYFSKDCNGRIEGHHYLGYSKDKSLDVMWLCTKHHHKIDGSWFDHK